jgi:CubicO group peptidase (beta-lactamase class C family)
LPTDETAGWNQDGAKERQTGLNKDASSTSSLEWLIERFDKLIASGAIPGTSILVMQDDREYFHAFGATAIGGEPIQRSTIFRISSMTKPIVATAMMTYVEEGRIGLDDPVDDYLPELAGLPVLRSVDSPLDDTVPANRPITVRDVMSLLLGTGILLAPPGTYPIQRAFDDLELGQGSPNPSLPPDPDEWIRRLGSLPLIYQPGERWLYNTGSDVLGILLARVAGSALEQVLRDRMFAPLGMDDTAFSVPAGKVDRFVTSYGYDADSGSLAVFDPPSGGQWNNPPRFPSGAGGLVSTIDDFLTFARMLLNRGTHDGRQLLSQAAVEELTSSQVTPGQLEGVYPLLDGYQGWGLGMAVLTSEAPYGASRGSYGWNGGLGTTWINDPSEDLIAVLMTQVDFTSPNYPLIIDDFLAGTYEFVRDTKLGPEFDDENVELRRSNSTPM